MMISFQNYLKTLNLLIPSTAPILLLLLSPFLTTVLPLCVYMMYVETRAIFCCYTILSSAIAREVSPPMEVILDKTVC